MPGHSSLQRQRERRKALAANAAGLAAAAAVMYLMPYLFKTPQNDSALTGHAWVCELLAGHPRRFHNMIGMSKHVFHKLVNELRLYAGLRDTKHIALEEQVALFLHICRTGGSQRDIQERFQHSPGTISR